MNLLHLKFFIFLLTSFGVIQSPLFGAVETRVIDRTHQFYSRAVRLSQTDRAQTLVNLATTNRLVVFLAGPNEGQKISAAFESQDLDALKNQLGWTDQNVKEWAKQGLTAYHYKTKSKSVLLGTWTNVVRIIIDQKPVLSDLFKKHLPDLRSTRYSEFSAQDGYERWVTTITENDIVNYSKSNPGETMKVAAMLRAYLEKNANCNANYSGDGYTYDSSGNRMGKEYVTANHKFKYVTNLKNEMSLSTD